MAAPSLKPDQYKKRWDYNVRQIFNMITPANGKLTDDQLDIYVKQLVLIEKDLANVKSVPLIDGLMKSKLNELFKDYKLDKRIKLVDYPTPEPTQADLNAIFDSRYMPTKEDIKESRKRLGVLKDEKPKGRPRIPKPTAPTGPFDTNNNITLAPNPPTIYDAIQNADIRRINVELKDPSFDPDQTFKATITTLGAAPTTIDSQLTPFQYAVLAGLKGVVRLLLKSKVDINKRINGLTLSEAVDQYRVNDNDKVYVKFVLQIANTATQDATDDYSAGVKLDPKYGEGMEDDVDKGLAKMLYEREYKELENPTLLKTPTKTTTGLVDEARRRGKEDAEKGLERSIEYLAKPDVEKNAYQAEYTKYITEKDKKKGKSDGETGSPADASYNTKTPEEKEAYGKEYDKARAAYQGEKDGLVNQPSNYEALETDLSQYYQTAPEVYKTLVKKAYTDAYEKNRSKTSDLVKEAGYVGTYPPSEALLSGNFFGFSAELSKIVGFDSSGETPKADTDAQYKEGLNEFVKNLQSIIGQAKYAGYTDGRKKNAKYTTPGKISVKGKEYAIDFGKLNTRLTELPVVSATGVLQETAESGQSERVLTELRRMRDSLVDADSFENMVAYVRDQSETNPNPKVKQILKSIAVSQKGGATSFLDRQRLYDQIGKIKNEELRTTLREKITPTITDATFNRLQTDVDSALANQPESPTEPEIPPIPEVPVKTESQRLAEETRLANERMKQDAQNIIDQLTNGPRKQELTDRLNLPSADYKSIRDEARVALFDQTQQPPVPEEPGFISKTLTKASELGTATAMKAKELGTSAVTAVSTGAQTVGTKISTGAQAVGTKISTGLGSVTTKSQLYTIVQQAFANIPKYVTTELKDPPAGVSPDDPSLGADINPIKRVQAMYDKEFERGYKEAMKPAGGTRRKSKKTSRITKKKVSKK